MKRAELEHVLRAVGAITDETDFIVIGSQAILGVADEPPEELVVSMEVDLYPEKAAHKSDLIDGSIGELSPFHATFGYYAHGVGPHTAIAPVDWRNRVIALQNSNTRGVVGWCLAPVGLAISKLAAGRDKDLAYVRALIRYRYVEPNTIEALLGRVPVEYQSNIRARLRRCLEGESEE